MTEANTMSQRARAATGWRWLKIQVPPDLYNMFRSLAAAHKLSMAEAMLGAVQLATWETSRDWWRRRGRAPKMRLRRRDAGKRRAERAGGSGRAHLPSAPGGEC